MPAGCFRYLVEQQQQRVGEVTDIDKVPELVPHGVRASCIGAQKIYNKVEVVLVNRINCEL